MAVETAPVPKHSPSESLWGFARRWLEPRSSDRDEAFRERSIRVAIALIFALAFISFASTVLVFQNEWKLISFPTFHVLLLTGYGIAAYTMSRQQVGAAATALVAASLAGAAGFTVLAGQEGSSVGYVIGVPIFMTVILLAALAMARNTIMLVSFSAVVIYSLSLAAVASGNAAFASRDLSQAIMASLVLLPAEGVILRRLRIEFDARLDAMQASITQAELAQRQAEEARLQAEEARQQAEVERNRAKESDKAKTQFLANMSHELRTPLNAIIGYDEAMLGGLVGEFTPHQTKLLGNIQFNSRRLLGLINDILDLAKIESGSLQVFLSPMAPQKLLRETVESVRSLAETKSIDLNIFFSDDVPEVVLGDANKLQQILINLLSNAIKFTDEGGVTVDVGIVDTTRWHIKVRDTGIGMHEDVKTLIFEPFQQVDGTDKRKYKGTGLGLAITQRLVERLGGTIDLDTTFGVGSTFTVILPRAYVPGDTVPENEMTPNEELQK